MGNLFNTKMLLHRKFDLKGSTLGRTAGETVRDGGATIGLRRDYETSDVTAQRNVNPALYPPPCPTLYSLTRPLPQAPLTWMILTSSTRTSTCRAPSSWSAAGTSGCSTRSKPTARYWRPARWGGIGPKAGEVQYRVPVEEVLR